MSKIKNTKRVFSLILAMTALGACGAEADVAEVEANEGSATSELRSCRDVSAFVVSAYDRVLNKLDKRALETMFAADMIQHNPAVADGTAGLAALIDFRKAQQPEAHNEIKRVIAQDDLVALQVHVTTSLADRNNENAGIAIVDIFRVARGKIVEHWDVIQPVPPVSASGNTMFNGAGLQPSEVRVRPGQLRKNANLVVTAYETVLNAFDTSPLGTVFDTGMVQHNPNFPNGTTALAGFAAFRRTQQPEAHNQVERVIAQGDLVLMHVHVTTSAADRSNEHAGVGIVDIFRVAGDKIVEHWDVVQPVPPTSVNTHTMFDGGARGHFVP